MSTDLFIVDRRVAFTLAHGRQAPPHEQFGFVLRCPFKPPKQSGRCWTVSSPDVAGVPRVRPWRGALGTAAETLEGLSGFRVYVDAARQHASVQGLRRTVGAALDPCVGPRQPGGVLGTGDVDALHGYY